MKSNGVVDTIKHTLLSNGKPCRNSDKSKENCWICCRLSRFKQVAFILALSLVFLLVTCKSVLHISSPGDIFSLSSNRNDQYADDIVWDKIRIKHTKRRLPECLIIGVRKAGTRALITFLNLHPQIQTAKNEVHFFDDDDTYSNGLDWYRKRMPYSFPGQITIEKTPGYFKTSETPERVYKMNATVKLLLIVRDPTERAISDYLQMHLKRLGENKPSDRFEVVALDSDGELDTSYAVLRRSLYYKYMRNWLNYFSLKQFLFVDGENLVVNPIQELRSVEKFLGLQHRITGDMFFYNASRGFYCIRNSTEHKCLNPSKGRKHPDIDPGIIHRLRRYFRPYNQRFFQMIEKRFDWPEE